MSAADWIGRDLGTRVVAYTEYDAILYALAVGAPADRLDLVFEDQLRVLPTFGLTLAQWAPDVLAHAGAFDSRSVHGAQTLTVHRPLPRSGELELCARVSGVWDKGAAAIFEIDVQCAEFTARWSIFAPGAGGFGGDRGPARTPAVEAPVTAEVELPLAPNMAALYRLTGDRHHIHIDPAAASRIGQDKPIMQGLCTLAAAVLRLADASDAHPAELTRLEGRFTGPALPGDVLRIRQQGEGHFDVASPAGSPVISDGKAVFS
ncbi:MaoC/PaaZ C-terminal domain-containing protein [Salinibacterium sp. ZJ70]|uniref:MaoC/PaaZ C-terminal domain-containing protein n=1 Tax=Salinibacterium sp. ZJ70 TaxID=2708084 RepID=UPI001CD358DD|nr:MaoC/PaaZ C-terminal domain-containing protein [Salinibacterium sp. ZJ70]